MKFKLSILALACSALVSHAQSTNPASYQTVEYNTSKILNSINASSAYARGYTGLGSTIAILDTGIDLKSTDFGNRIISTKDFVNSGSVQDTNGHGTFIAGEAAASANGLGVQGTAYNANLLIGKIAGTNGISFDATIINAIAWAGNNNATVVNLSSELTTNYGAKLASAGIYTVTNMTNTPNYWTKVVAENPNNWLSAMNTNPNMVLVVAAGNSGLNYVSGYGELAVATNPNGSLMFGGRIIVAGNYNTQFNMLSPSSNAAGTICMNFVNNTCQDQYKISQFFLMAPGTNVVSTAVGGGTTTMSGTSMAAPVISGAVAIINQQWPKMTGSNIVQLLLQTANKNIPNYKVAINGQGLLDLAAATSPVGALNIPTTGRTTGPALSPVLVTSGSASLGKLSSVMVFDGYQRDFYTKGTSLQTRMPVKEFNARQVALPYQTHNPYTQFNTYTNYTKSKIGNLEFTSYRDTNRDPSQDQSLMVEIGYTKDNFKFTAGTFSEQNTWLGNYTNSINVNSQSLTSYVGVNFSKVYKETELYANFHNGITSANAHGDYITNIGSVLSYSWSLGAERHINKENSLGFMVYQPVAVYRAIASTNIPTGFDNGGNIMYANNVNLAAGVKEMRLGGYWKFADKTNSNMLAFVESRQNYQGVQGLNETAAGLSVNYKF
jgi:hypothetical protein